MSDDWDVESYRTEFESEEHWELRKNFMLTHKDRLPEEEIVCLAQVFTNIEFLGCRYPDETMTKVAELAKGVIESYREKKKNCLKRTTVTATFAAASKVKGLNDASGLKTKRENSKNMSRNFKNIKQYKGKNLNRKRFNSQTNYRFKSDLSIKSLGIDGNGTRHYHADSSETSASCDLNIKKPNGPFADFVLFMFDDPPGNLLERNAALNKYSFSWKYTPLHNNLIACSVYLNNHLIGAGEGKSKKNGRELAAREGIQKLKSSCYTIKIKEKFASNNMISPVELESSPAETFNTNCNIGEQIMKLMGWTGGGLGVKHQGMIEPVSVLGNTGRSGLGLKFTADSDIGFKIRAKNLIRDWMDCDTDEDLIFTSQFSIEQRRILHGLARNLSLRSKSYGKGNDRHLVVSKKPSPWKIVEELMKVGGITRKYELIVPD